MAHRHMRRSAISAGSPGGLITENYLEREYAGGAVGRKAKNFRGDFTFFKMLSAFRYQKVVVSFPPFER